MLETPMTRRFLRCIWSPTRILMDAMQDGETVTLPLKHYGSALVTARRLRDAYEGQRSWRVKLGKGEFTISHKTTQQ